MIPEATVEVGAPDGVFRHRREPEVDDVSSEQAVGRGVRGSTSGSRVPSEHSVDICGFSNAECSGAFAASFARPPRDHRQGGRGQRRQEEVGLERRQSSGRREGRQKERSLKKERREAKQRVD